MIPILRDHNYDEEPIGKIVDNKITIAPGKSITQEQLLNLGIGYIPTKVMGDGTVLEAELIEVSIITPPLKPAIPSTKPGSTL